MQSWRHNALYNPVDTDMETGQRSGQEMNNQDMRQANVLGKRTSMYTQQVVPGGSNMLAIVPSTGKTSNVAAIVDQFEGDTLPGITLETASTP